MDSQSSTKRLCSVQFGDTQTFDETNVAADRTSMPHSVSGLFPSEDFSLDHDDLALFGHGSSKHCMVELRGFEPLTL